MPVPVQHASLVRVVARVRIRVVGLALYRVRVTVRVIGSWLG